MPKKICLDAGHFAKYNPNYNCSPTYWESHMAWSLHLYLKSALESYGFTVVTTRTDRDTDLGLMSRGQKAKGCDLFLSLHSNACDTESVDRAVVIYPVDDRCIDLATNLSQTITQTMELKDKPQIYNKWNSAHNADWYGVIRGAVSVGVPGLILEHSFHTNNRSAAWLNSDANLKKLAAAEAKTLAQYYGMQAQPEPQPQPGMTESQIKEFITQEVTRQTQAIQKELDKKVAKISTELSKAYGEALTSALASISDFVDQKITDRVGKEIVHLSDIPGDATRAEFKPLLDEEFIDGGTPKKKDATDIRLPLSTVRAILVAKRYTDAKTKK